MDHLHTVLDGDSDDLVASQVGADRGELTSLANDVGFVGLCDTGSAFVTKTRQGESLILCRCMLRRSS